MSYETLYDVYDRFNDEPDFLHYIDKVKKAFGMPENGLALDCGCGTGTLLLTLSKLGYDCTGTDGSCAMLGIAREKLAAEGFTPHLICQDLTELDLYGAYNVVFCTLDTVNHLTSKRDLKSFFDRLFCFVEPGGVFFFDVKTKEGFRNGCGARICDEGDVFFTLQGGFDGTYALYHFTVFRDGIRTDDEVEERYYDAATLKKMLKDAGFTPLGKIPYGKNRAIFAARKEV